MKTTVSILFILLANLSFTQTTISGTVLEKNGNPIIGANVFIEGSYDGGITEIDGSFKFSTDLTGTQSLLISYLAYESKKIEDDVLKMNNLDIKLRPSALSLDAVEITASTFKAGDNSKVAVLKPLDVVTTAGSMGDVIAALQTLPGTQANPEDGRLFVRGGDASETKIYIDGLRVFTPYSRTIGGSPTRGRYSPFLFKGMSFSTGGYSAAYGQALSGILDMNTIDEPANTETNISLMTVGVGLGHTQKWDKQSISLSASYINIGPYQKLISSRLRQIEPFQGFSGETVYRYKLGNGLIKSYVAGDFQKVRVSQFDINSNQDQEIAFKNYNLYSNTTIHSSLNDQTDLHAGVSFGINKDKSNIGQSQLDDKLNGIHGRVALKSFINDHFIVNYGVDHLYQSNDFIKSIITETGSFTDKVSRHINGQFVESDYFFTQKSAIKLGLRTEYHSLFDTYEFSPRLTFAQKLTSNAQISAAMGTFRQEINTEYLYDYNNAISEKANHFLVNYNYKSKKQILRLEAFYKGYSDLIKFEGDTGSRHNYSNEGHGAAHGIDLFWRASGVVKNLDFWISYSWLNNNREYKNWPTSATPPFSTSHNLSVVGKRWISKLKSQVSFTYNLTSGRPYENPNTPGFLNERAKPFHNMSMSWAYLISQQKILFVSVSNFPGFKNEFGYRYGNQPDAAGVYPGEVIKPNEDRFFFVGFFVTMSPDKTKNQLDNL